ncbi:MAG: 30S ribosomal protein S16 [Erysipelotrichaceae bacterium]|jgi:small subunit ribosomal protein S16|nr:30S ribosomal protein S16 [Erysipelotrichaceae bacterium]
MVKIRFQRAGRKSEPFYHIVVSDSRTAKDGKYIEKIGYFNPHKEAKDAVIETELALKWLNNGAVPSETVKAIFRAKGINEAFAKQKVKQG